MAGLEKEIRTEFGTFLLRPYRDEDEEGVVRLWESAFGKTLDRRIWRWKFHGNPFGREVMVCVDQSNKPVVFHGGIPFPAQWNMQKIIMTQCIDSMSHPDYRHILSDGKKLFTLTVEHFFNVFGNTRLSTIHYGFPGIKHYNLGNLLLSYTAMPHEHFYFELKINLFKRSRFTASENIRVLHEIDEQFDKLWQKNKREYPYSVIRNSRFLSWRFFHHPVHSYRTLGLFNTKNELTGYLIFLPGNKTATIVDIFSAGDKDELDRLIRAGINMLIQEKIKRVRIWIPDNHFITRGLIESGFKKTKEPIGIVPAYREYNGTIDLTHFDAFFYTMADGDLF